MSSSRRKRKHRIKWAYFIYSTYPPNIVWLYFLNYLFKFIYTLYGIKLYYIMNIRSYKRAFRELFLSSDANIDKNSDADDAADPVSEYRRFGWLLFLALRIHAFSRFKDLVTCTNGFVSVLVSYNLLLLYLLVTLLLILGCRPFFNEL